MSKLPKFPTKSKIWEEICIKFVTCEFDSAMTMSMELLSPKKPILGPKTTKQPDTRNVKVPLWHPINQVEVQIIDSTDLHRHDWVHSLLDIILQCAYELRDQESILFCAEYCNRQGFININTLLLWLELKLKDQEDVAVVCASLHAALLTEVKSCCHIKGHVFQECAMCQALGQATDLLVRRILLPSRKGRQALEVTRASCAVLPTLQCQDLVDLAERYLEKKALATFKHKNPTQGNSLENKNGLTTRPNQGDVCLEQLDARGATNNETKVTLGKQVNDGDKLSSWPSTGQVIAAAGITGVTVVAMINQRHRILKLGKRVWQYFCDDPPI